MPLPHSHSIIILQQSSLTAMLSPILATVNINMGLHHNNPTLTITHNTNVHQLISQFIAQFQLPYSAYEVIMEAIDRELERVGIRVGDLGQVTPKGRKQKAVQGERGMQGDRPENRVDNRVDRGVENRVDKGVAWEQVRAKREPLLKIENQRKVTSPLCLEKEVKPTKITLLRTKSPILKAQRSPCQTRRSRSPAQAKTPPSHSRPRPQPQPLSQIFDSLTRHQPKSIRVLSPEYVTFNGINPCSLSILQQFFEQVQEQQFVHMDREYFIARIRQYPQLVRRLLQSWGGAVIQ